MDPFDEPEGRGAQRWAAGAVKCSFGTALWSPVVYAISQTNHPVEFGVMAFCYVLIATWRARSFYLGALFAFGAHCVCGLMGSLAALGAGCLGMGQEWVIGTLLASQASAVLIVVLKRTDDGFCSK